MLKSSLVRMRNPSKFCWRNATAPSLRVRTIGSISSFRIPTLRDNADTTVLRIRQQMTAPPGEVDTSIDATGRFVWPTALYLLERIQQDFFETTDDAASLNVLELGSGCGLLGMGLAATSLRTTVVATDHPNSIDWLHGNVELNQDALRKGNIFVAPLEWGDRQAAEGIQALRGAFDLILGSDLLYICPSDYPRLVDTLKIVSGGAPVYLAYPKRGTEDVFFDIAKDAFTVEIEAIDVSSACSQTVMVLSTGKYELAILRLKSG